MNHYSANITAGPLMLPESRKVASLMLTSPTSLQWRQAIRIDNLLQKTTPATAWRQAGLIRARLEMLPPDGWQLIAQSGVQEIATQTLFAASVLHSRLLADFVRDVVAGHHRRLETAMARREWESFLTDCMARDPGVATWTSSTRGKLFQVIVHMLVEARYLDSVRSLKLRAPDLHPQVRSLLRDMGEHNVINILELRS